MSINEDSQMDDNKPEPNIIYMNSAKHPQKIGGVPLFNNEDSAQSANKMNDQMVMNVQRQNFGENTQSDIEDYNTPQ